MPFHVCRNTCSLSSPQQSCLQARTSADVMPSDTCREARTLTSEASSQHVCGPLCLIQGTAVACSHLLHCQQLGSQASLLQRILVSMLETHQRCGRARAEPGGLASVQQLRDAGRAGRLPSVTDHLHVRCGSKVRSRLYSSGDRTYRRCAIHDMSSYRHQGGSDARGVGATPESCRTQHPADGLQRWCGDCISIFLTKHGRCTTGRN